MVVTNPVIGHATCPDCKATVELRINKNRKVYWHCDGRAADVQCNAMHKHGAAVSRRMIAQAAKAKTEANDNKQVKEPENEQPANDNRQPEQSKGKPGGFGLFGG